MYCFQLKKNTRLLLLAVDYTWENDTKVPDYLWENYTKLLEYLWENDTKALYYLWENDTTQCYMKCMQCKR